MATARLVLRAPLRIAIAPLALPRRLPPRLRRWLLVLGVLAILLTVAFLWLRDSSLVKVEHVGFTGVSGRSAPAIRSALERAAREMTTLDFDARRLSVAGARFPGVAEVQATPHFPNGVQIQVVMRQPVAIAISGDERVPVAADGTLLRGSRAPRSLPPLALARLPRGARLTDPVARQSVTVIADAPTPLRSKVDRIVAERRTGLTVVLQGGLKLIFGDAEHARAKWVAAASVLADPDAAGATYIDVSTPDRPAVGGLGGSGAPGADATSAGQSQGVQPPAAEQQSADSQGDQAAADAGGMPTDPSQQTQYEAPPAEDPGAVNDAGATADQIP